jgi:hypothetical protein
MSDPNNGLRWLIALVCCPAPLAFIAGVLLATAFQRGWIRSPINPDRAPRWPWRRPVDE